jgi:hypothetical protein
MKNLLMRSLKFLVVFSVAVLVWMGGFANHDVAQADPPGAEYSSSQSSLDFEIEQEPKLEKPAAALNDSEALRSRIEREDTNFFEDTGDKLKDAAENVREKLNLDQPIAPETEEFVRDVKDKLNLER